MSLHRPRRPVTRNCWVSSSDLDPVTGNYLSVISYLSVPVAATSTTAATHTLMRAYCTGEGSNFTLQSEETLAFDVSGTQAVPKVNCVGGATTCAVSPRTG